MLFCNGKVNETNYFLFRVSYLAGRALRKLKKENHKLSLTEGEITLVQIAGLCHDLGKVFCLLLHETRL